MPVAEVFSRMASDLIKKFIIDKNSRQLFKYREGEKSTLVNNYYKL